MTTHEEFQKFSHDEKAAFLALQRYESLFWADGDFFLRSIRKGCRSVKVAKLQLKIVALMLSRQELGRAREAFDMIVRRENLENTWQSLFHRLGDAEEVQEYGVRLHHSDVPMARRWPMPINFYFTETVKMVNVLAIGQEKILLLKVNSETREREEEMISYGEWKARRAFASLEPMVNDRLIEQTNKNGARSLSPFNKNCDIVYP